MNPEQIKIIVVVIATLIFAILIDSSRSRSSSISEISDMLAAVESNTSSSTNAKVSSSKPSCTKKGIKLYGNVKFVDSFEDLKIKYVTSFSDIDVKFVSSFASSCGKWKIVDSHPDFTVKVVTSFEDLNVKKVSSFPGMK